VLGLKLRLTIALPAPLKLTSIGLIGGLLLLLLSLILIGSPVEKYLLGVLYLSPTIACSLVNGLLELLCRKWTL